MLHLNEEIYSDTLESFCKESMDQNGITLFLDKSSLHKSLKITGVK